MKRFLLIATYLFNIAFLTGCSVAAIGMSAYTHTQLILVQEKMIVKDRGVMFDLIQDNSNNQPDSQSKDSNTDVRVKVIFVRPQSDAEKVGLQKGDEIILINGQTPSNSNNIINLFFDKYDNPIVIKVKRNETEIVTKLMPL
jgi:S1-C subfamily serine protease